MSGQSLPDLRLALEDPKAGPRPITLEEYRRRQSTRRPQEAPTQPQPKKQKSGSEAYFKRRLQEAQRELVFARTKEAKRLADKHIQEIKTERTNYRKKKKAAKQKMK